MKYFVEYGIDHGCSTGLGFKYPSYIEESEEIEAANEFEAMSKAVERARVFAMDYLSNPETEMTTVCLLSLKDFSGNKLQQRTLIDKIDFNENDNAVIKCSMLEHILDLLRE